MKTKKLFRLLPLFICAISFASCGNDDEKEIYPLSFEKEYYEVSVSRHYSISIRGGNRDYNITVAKPDILDATVDLSSPVGMGNLAINAKKKGETVVTVKDNITHETVELTIKVTDGYLAYSIHESNHPALSQGTFVYLINNEAKDCYFFRDMEGAPHYPVARGTYGFSLKEEHGTGNNSPNYAIPYLTLNYAANDEGEFTDAAIAPTPHRLRFELFDGVTNSIVLDMIHHFLGVVWEELPRTRLDNVSPAPPPTLKMTIDDTDYVIIGILQPTPPIPENILD